MIPVRQVVPEALAIILREAPLTDEKVAFAWRAAVGPAVAQASSVSFRGGVLSVTAADPAWRREIARAAHLIQPKLDHVLGPGVVERIEVIGLRTPPPGAARTGPRRR